MPEIENRGIQMTFDNANFERKLSETIKSLGDLKKSLDFANAQNSLANVGKAANGITLEGITSAIENVSGRFLTMSTIAITALSQITSRAISAGVSIVKSLSLDQVISGFQEYETNMKSIQTILANTKADGTNLQQVNAALDELNNYADQTIYNFAEMARNIGTFTAAGVDLDTSVDSIKGIANAAAISGSTSQQASTAMYQLSQAIASGSLKLMDWNSVVNAGMGGEVMQKALFDTGKAMKTLTDVPIEMTFDEWKDAGNTFRESLADGWVTTEVLTTALKGFSGEATDAELAAKGFTEEMIGQFRELGETGVEAATKVRTFTQLMDTAKEAVGSGWSQTFRIVLGDFEEATQLFTGISEAFGTFVDASSTARNEFFQGWKDLGGRTLLIQALKNAFYALGQIIAPIKEAFRVIFPKSTSQDLFELTQAFALFAQKLIPSQKTIENIKSIFLGLFSALQIGWEVIKGFAGVFKNLLSDVLPAGEGVLSFFADIGDKITLFRNKLIIMGRLNLFFENLEQSIRNFATALQDPLEALKDFGKGVASLFSGDGEGSFGAVEGVIDRLGARFESLKGTFEALGRIFQPIIDAGKAIAGALEEVWIVIRDWFSELGTNIADNMEEGDFDAVVDLVNVGLLGGIAAILAKFFKDGIKFDLGEGGFFSAITDTLGELNGVLSAMQTDLKANALLKIAGAVALLTASVVVLSLVDSAALTKALAAMAVGFTQLMAAFAILTKLSAGPKGAASLVATSTGIAILAGALLLLSISVKILSTMGWEELAKGLGGTIVLLGVLTTAVRLMSGNTAGMIKAGIGILFIATAMNILAIALKIMATMSWEELARGLAGVAGGLGAIVLAMNLLPKGMATKAAGLVLVGVALNLLATSMVLISTLSWEDIAKGLVGIAGGLLLIALAMNLMPLSLPITAAGLVLVGVALNAIAASMLLFSTMSWEEIGRGLAAMAGALVVLAAATYAMSGTLVGAIAIGLVALSLGTLFKVLVDFSKLKIGDLLKGLLSIGIAIGALALGALALGPAIGALFALGAALLVLGAGFALFGVGAALTAKAFQILAKAGKAGVEVLIAVMDAVISRIPDLIKAFAEGLIELAMVFLEAAPVLLEALEEVLLQLLDTIINIAPKLAETVTVLILELLQTIRDIFPDVVETGLDLLLEFLRGIRDNIEEVVTLGTEILVNFLEGLAQNIGDVVTAAAELLAAFVDAVVDNMDTILGAGADLLAGILQGIADNISTVIDTVFDIAQEFITGVATHITEFLTVGADALVNILQGIADNISTVIDTVFAISQEFITGVATHIAEFALAGANALSHMLEGIAGALGTVANTVVQIALEFMFWIGEKAFLLSAAGIYMLAKMLESTQAMILAIAHYVGIFIINVLNGIGQEIHDRAGDFRNLGKNMALTVLSGLTGGLSEKIPGLDVRFKQMGYDIEQSGEKGLEVNSPSKIGMRLGASIIEGMAYGLKNDQSVDKAMPEVLKASVRSISGSLSRIPDMLENDGYLSPKITPILDLTQVKTDAKELTQLLGADSSYLAASNIASTRLDFENAAEVDAARDVSFVQNNYSPSQLSTADIYRQTRNQIALAKEELEVK